MSAKATEAEGRVVLWAGCVAGAGGAERVLWEEEKYLSARGIDTVVLTTGVANDGLMGYAPKQLQVLPRARSVLGRLRVLRQAVRRLAPDLVIAHTPRCALGLCLATWPRGVPYIVFIHGTLFWHRHHFHQLRDSIQGHREFIPCTHHFTPPSRIRTELEAVIDYLAIRRARQIVTLTDHLRWEIQQLYGRDSVIAHGGCSAQAPSPTPPRDIRKKLEIADRRIILSVGRLDPRKRVDVIISAFARVALLHPHAALLIGGKGEEEERLRALARQLDIADSVRFLGFIPEDELFDYYAACDVFVFPSWTSHGMTHYEALAAGAKVVWTSEADEPVLQDPHVFVADPTPKAFADAICRALDTNLTTPIDLSAYTWDRYFDTVYAEGIRPFLSRPER